jgi:ankyrin repeat protein
MGAKLGCRQASEFILGTIIVLILGMTCGSVRAASQNVYPDNPEGDLRLIDAAKEGDTDTIRRLVESGVNLRIRDHVMGAPPLTWAIVYDHLESARLLLDSRAEVDAIDTVGRTALIMAAHNGEFEGAKLLLEYKVDVNFRDHCGGTPLTHASTYSGTNQIIELLLKNGASEGLQEALASAVSTGRTDMARTLINSGGDVNSKYHPLMMATKHGYEDLVRLLLASGADVNEKTDEGETPLILAALLNYENIIMILLGAGADANAVSKGGEAFEILVDIGTDEGVLSKTGVSALMLARTNGNQTVIKALLDAGANK